MLVRIAFVLLVGVFAVERALAIKTSGEISISTSGQDCGEIVRGRHLVTLEQKREGEGRFAPMTYKLTMQLADGNTATLSAFRKEQEVLSGERYGIAFAASLPLASSSQERD